MTSSNGKNPFDLSGMTALVTGSSKGLGRAMNLALAEAGAKVVVNYHNGKEKAEEAHADLKARGHEAIMVRADVTDPAAVNALITEIEEKLGTVDILIPNATCDQPHHPIEEYSWEFYQSMVDFFIKSPYLLITRCLPNMKAKKFGRIINIGSEVFQIGVPEFTAYVAAKGAQNGMTRSLGKELAKFGITANTLSPGWIPVERHETEPQEWKDNYLPQIPAGRWGVPSDLATTVVWLASPGTSFVCGQNICVNGGMTVA